jgi:phosphoglycolate phosphatase
MDISSIDTFVFDCDGVLWNGDFVIDGAPQTINKLKELGKNVIFLSNNSTKTRAEYKIKLNKLGFEATEKEIVCSAFVAANYLKENNFQGKLYVVGSKGIGGELDQVNIKHIGVGPDDEPFDNFSPLDPEVTGIIVGFDRNFSYTKMFKACSYIALGCKFYATNDDANVPSPVSGYILPGTGTMVKAIQTGSGVDPLVFGKPHHHTFTVLQHIHNINPKRSIMIGDRLETDIYFGKEFGLQTAAVLTGIITEESLKTIPKDKKPDFVIPSVKHLLNFL